MISKIIAAGALGLAVLGGGAYAGMQYVKTTVDTPTTVTETSYGDSCCAGMKDESSPEVAAVQAIEPGSPFDVAEQTTQQDCPTMATAECPTMATAECPTMNAAECAIMKPGCEPGDKECTMETAQNAGAEDATPVAAAAVTVD